MSLVTLAPHHGVQTPSVVSSDAAGGGVSSDLDPLGAASATPLDAIPPVESSPDAAPPIFPAARDVPLPEPPQSPATLTPPKRRRRR